jgi:hypothetical protein
LVKGLKVEHEAGPASSRPDVQQIDALKTLEHESRIVGVDVWMPEQTRAEFDPSD